MRLAGIAAAGALHLVVAASCVAQVPAACTEKIITPEVTRVVQLLQSANALTDAAAKQTAITNARRNLSQTLLTATTFATCLGAPAQAKSLGSVLELRRFDKQVGASGGGA